MEAMTQEQMLDKYVGKKGTPEREEYEAEVRKALDDYRIGEAIKAERRKSRKEFYIFKNFGLSICGRPF